MAGFPNTMLKYPARRSVHQTARSVRAARPHGKAKTVACEVPAPSEPVVHSQWTPARGPLARMLLTLERNIDFLTTDH